MTLFLVIVICAVLFFLFIKYLLPWLLLFLFGKWLIKHKERVDPSSIVIGAILGYLFARLWERVAKKQNPYV